MTSSCRAGRNCRLRTSCDRPDSATNHPTASRPLRQRPRSSRYMPTQQLGSGARGQRGAGGEPICQREDTRRSQRFPSRSSSEVIHLVRPERHGRNHVSTRWIQRHRLTGSERGNHTDERHCRRAVVDAEAACGGATSTGPLNIEPEDTGRRQPGLAPAGHERCNRYRIRGGARCTLTGWLRPHRFSEQSLATCVYVALPRSRSGRTRSAGRHTERPVAVREGHTTSFDRSARD